MNCLGRNEIGIITFDESGRRVPVGPRPKTARLLTLLAAAGSRSLPRTTLIAELWPEAEAEDAGNRLKQQIRDLRTLTTYDGVISGDGHYSLNCRLVMTDIQRLEEAIHDFSDPVGRLEQRIAAFDRALNLYRGPLLPHTDARLVKERQKSLVASLKARGTAFLKTLAEQDAAKAAPRRDRLAKLG